MMEDEQLRPRLAGEAHGLRIGIRRGNRSSVHAAAGNRSIGERHAMPTAHLQNKQPTPLSLPHCVQGGWGVW